MSVKQLKIIGVSILATWLTLMIGVCFWGCNKTRNFRMEVIESSMHGQIIRDKETGKKYYKDGKAIIELP
jgi:hypothetical protein